MSVFECVTSVCVSTQTHHSNRVGVCVSVCNAIQYIDPLAVCCSELQCFAVWYRALHCVCM